MTFEQAVAHVLREEGGYANNPVDPGGETKFGISKRSYPHLDIAALTQAEAVAIYRRDFWLAAGCEHAPPKLRGVLFDAAVNCGRVQAVKWAQLIAGAVPDGIIGPQTRGAWASGDDESMAEDFHNIRLQHHARIAQKKPALRVFLPGWILRCVRVRNFALDH